MKKINFATILIGLTMLAFTANAQHQGHDQKPAVKDSVQKVFIDPVCKMKVKPNAEKSAVHNKVTYYFCAESCKNKFVAEPTKYIKK